MVVAGAADQELRVYELKIEGSEGENNGGGNNGVARGGVGNNSVATRQQQQQQQQHLVYKGSVRRTAPQRVLCCGFVATGEGGFVLYAATVGKMVELYRCVLLLLLLHL